MFDAFWVLSNQRTYNMGGPNPIAVSDMAAMLDGLCIRSPDSREAYISAWVRMDGAFIAYTIENRPEPTAEV